MKIIYYIYLLTLVVVKSTIKIKRRKSKTQGKIVESDSGTSKYWDSICKLGN
jgi:hypothetical protein